MEKYWNNKEVSYTVISRWQAPIMQLLIRASLKHVLNYRITDEWNKFFSHALNQHS